MCAVLNKKEIVKIIDVLRAKRRVFSSEDDFKLALAIEIQNKYQRAKVHCEYPLTIDGVNMHVDIMVILDEKWYPIELKYKTKKIDSKRNYIIDDGVKYLIKNQFGVDNACYDYIKDITRIEKIKKDSEWNDKIRNGFTIFVTNENRYFEGPRQTNVKHKEFALWDNTKPLSREMNWAEDTSENSKKIRPTPLEVSKDYYCKWNSYSIIRQEGITTRFKYLLHKI